MSLRVFASRSATASRTLVATAASSLNVASAFAAAIAFLPPSRTASSRIAFASSVRSEREVADAVTLLGPAPLAPGCERRHGGRDPRAAERESGGLGERTVAREHRDREVGRFVTREREQRLEALRDHLGLVLVIE